MKAFTKTNRMFTKAVNTVFFIFLGLELILPVAAGIGNGSIGVMASVFVAIGMFFYAPIVIVFAFLKKFFPDQNGNFISLTVGMKLGLMVFSAIGGGIFYWLEGDYNIDADAIVPIWMVAGAFFGMIGGYFSHGYDPDFIRVGDSKLDENLVKFFNPSATGLPEEKIEEVNPDEIIFTHHDSIKVEVTEQFYAQAT